jgi:membrane-associated phospholipid phosphatase
VLVVRVETGTGTRWWPETLLLGGFVVLTLALANGLMLDLDVAVRDWSDAHRPRVPYLAARGLNFVGSANLVAPIVLGISAVVAVRVRSIRPLLPLIAGFVIAYVLIVPLKMLADRAAPHSPVADPVQIFHHPPGWSYPSGHVANTVYLFGILAVLVNALLRGFGWNEMRPATRRILRIAPPAIVIVTTTYLGFHWLTDAVAGLLLGLLLDRVLWRLPWSDLPLGRRPLDRGWDRQVREIAVSSTKC